MTERAYFAAFFRPPANTASPNNLCISEYLHPVSLASLFVLALNDHVLKGAGILPTWVTGKLSDVAGMIFFPLLLGALWNSGAFLFTRLSVFIGTFNASPRRHALTHRQLLLAIVFTAVFFSFLNLFPSFADGYCRFTALIGMRSAVTTDITDLLTLPALFIAYRIGKKQITSANVRP